MLFSVIDDKGPLSMKTCMMRLDSNVKELTLYKIVLFEIAGFNGDPDLILPGFQ